MFLNFYLSTSTIIFQQKEQKKKQTKKQQKTRLNISNYCKRILTFSPCETSHILLVTIIHCNRIFLNDLIHQVGILTNDLNFYNPKRFRYSFFNLLLLIQSYRYNCLIKPVRETGHTISRFFYLCHSCKLFIGELFCLGGSFLQRTPCLFKYLMYIKSCPMWNLIAFLQSVWV